jgi:diphthamide biosynthesis protein 4
MKMTKPDHYEILNLPFPNPGGVTKQTLKLAYHRALLRHHPDKASPKTRKPDTLSSSAIPAASAQKTAAYTIDQITAAYKILSDPVLRAEYDRSLRLSRSRQTGQSSAGDGTKDDDVFYTGLEVVDLEDLTCDEAADAGQGDNWFRGCRCGDERGFLVTEEDLEREVENGEVVVGCRGCSLWVRVVFGLDDGDGGIEAG